MKKRIKKFWIENKDKVPAFVYGAGVMGLVAHLLIKYDEKGNELTSYNIAHSETANAPAADVLILTHKNGKTTVMEILDQIEA